MCILCLKSSNPKISKIGRQERNNEFRLINFGSKNIFGELFLEMTLKGLG